MRLEAAAVEETHATALYKANSWKLEESHLDDPNYFLPVFLFYFSIQSEKRINKRRKKIQKGKSVGRGRGREGWMEGWMERKDRWREEKREGEKQGKYKRNGYKETEE